LHTKATVALGKQTVEPKILRDPSIQGVTQALTFEIFVTNELKHFLFPVKSELEINVSEKSPESIVSVD
jgi:hypothetical protein